MKKNDTNYCESLIVKVDPNNGWNCHELDNGYILYKGFSILWEKVIENITVILSSNTCKNDIIDILKTTFGHFSIIIKSNNFLLAAVDNIRSIPLYYMDNKEVRFVTDNYRYFEDFCGEKLVSLPNCETEILMSGYSSFQDTLYKNIKTFLPGQIFYSHYKSGSFETNTNNYQAWLSKSDSSLELMYSRFNSILLEVMADTIKSLNGRQVVIPLSGGYDSRIIASTLKMLGCKNVVCFTYGMPNNSEAVIAKDVARKLEYKWIFVELDIRGQRTFYKSNEFFEYLSYVDTIDAVPYYQGIYAVKFLKENKLIDDDAIFINGLKESGLYNKVWQAGAILLPVNSVGVMGDERTYEKVVALRAVESTDGMTADWVNLPYEFLQKTSNQIINKVKGVNRVVYDISSKPPATIEWE